MSGLLAAQCLPRSANRVVCVDKDPAIVDTLQQGSCTIHEPGLEEILRARLRRARSRFSTDIVAAVESADAIFIAVGTPSLHSGSYDFQYVEAAARQIGRALQADRQYIIVLKSTVTPDIYSRVNAILTEATATSGAQFEVISNPEFLAEGTAVRDFSQPSRVVVGALSQGARDFMEALYAPFTKSKPGTLQFTNPKSAIVTKLAANSFLACRVVSSTKLHSTATRSALILNACAMDSPLTRASGIYSYTRGLAMVAAASERISGHCGRARGNMAAR